MFNLIFFVQFYNLQKFWEFLHEITENSDDTIIQLLKLLNFNNKISFKGYEMKQVTVDEISKAMETFVINLPPGSPHLNNLRISCATPKDFKLSFGQVMCLRSTMDLIVEKLNQMPLIELASSASTSRGGENRLVVQRERVIQEVDLLNIQATWNTKLKAALSKKNVCHDQFPIIRSLTANFPYKFWIKCPKCKKELIVTITIDKMRET